MQQINVRSDIPSSIIKMKKIMNNPDNTIVVAIVADWCGACQQFKPIWKSTVNRYLSMQQKKLNTKKLVLATVQDSTIHELNIGDIRGFPTIRNIKTLDEHLGGMSPEYLMEYIKNVSKRCKTIPNNKKNIKKSIKKSKKQKAKKTKKYKKQIKKTKSKKTRNKAKSKKQNKK